MSDPIDLLKMDYENRRRRNRSFSLRSYAKWMGLSPSQISQMLSGKRPITFKSLKKISERIGLSPNEKKNLFNSALSKNNFIQQSDSKRNLEFKEDQFRLISDWYHMAILAISKLKNKKADPRWLARRLGIRIEEANQALIRLQRLGLIKLKPVLEQIGDPFEIESRTPSEAIRKYHKQNLNLAIEKIETIPLQFRQFQSVSIPVDPSKIDKFKTLIDKFLDEAVDLAKEDEAKEIYNLNVQLFPITKLKEKP